MLDTKHALRLRIQLTHDDGQADRPACQLISIPDVDEDGRVWVCFTCNTHKQRWRELCAVLDADGLRGVLDIVSEGDPCAAAGVSDEDT